MGGFRLGMGGVPPSPQAAGVCLEALRGVTRAVCAGLQGNKIRAYDWQRDFCSAEELIVLSRCEKEPKSTQEVFPSWASPLFLRWNRLDVPGQLKTAPCLGG